MPIQMRSLLVIFVILLAGASFQARVGAQAGNPSAPDIRGIYLYSLNTVVDKFPANSPQVTHALSEPGVDGFTLVENWSSVEPERGVFEWDKLPDGQQGHFDQWVHAAVSAGRKINLAIRAGQDTPCWMFDLASQPCGPGYLGSYAGAREFTFVAASHQGQTQHPCEVVSMAAPWDPVFLREWDAMLAGVAAHLRAIGAYGSVALVRQTGVNRTTDEFRLPEEILPQPCTDANGIVHQNTNAISTWLAAGYRPWLLFLAWDAIDASFQRNFPGKTFNVPIIPIDTGRGQYPFPEIDARGCVYTAIVPKSSWNVPPAIPANTCTNNADLDTAKSQLKTVLSSFLWLSDVNAFGRLVVEFENLDTAEPASPTVVEASDELHSMMGFMTNNFVAAASSNDPDNDPGNNVGAACSGGFIQPVACGSDAEYLSLLEIGIYPCRNAPSDAFCRSATVQSAFIEVFAPDIVQFPSAICQAHNELLATPQSP